MTIKIVSDDFNRDVFNKKAPHPLQSWEWGEARKKMGIEVLRIGEFEGKLLQNIYQITFHKIPYTNLKIGYVPRSTFPSQESLRFLFEYGKKNNVIFMKLEPNREKITPIQSELKINHTQFRLVQSPHPLFPNWTIMLDTTLSEDELLNNMRPKTRYNLHLAEKKGILVKEMTNKEGFELFAKLYFETCKRQRYFGHTYSYHQTIFETLKNNIAHILIAFYKDIPLAAYEVFIFNDVLYYPYGGSSLAYRNLMGTNLLMWETIKFGKQHGAKRFDMWGSLAPDYDVKNPWAGFTRFKEGYGGKFVELVGSYDLIMNQPLYSVYNILRHIRKTILHFAW